MAGTRIQAPDGTTIEFPDSMKDQDIEAAMAKLYPHHEHPTTAEGYTSKLPWPLSGMDEFANDAVENTSRGLERIGHAFSPGNTERGKDIVGGASQAFRGAAPVMLGPMALQNPVTALRALPGAALGAGAGHLIGDSAGLAPEYQQGLEDVGGMAGAAYSNSRLSPFTRAAEDVARPFLGIPPGQVKLGPLPNRSPLSAPPADIAPMTPVNGPMPRGTIHVPQVAPAPSAAPRVPLYLNPNIKPADIAPLEPNNGPMPGASGPILGYDPDIDTHVEGTPIINPKVRRSK